MPKQPPPRVMREVLTRDLIVHTAVELVEREGPAALSMRAVGAELGVTAMAMYRHVTSRDDLLQGIAEYVMSGLEIPVGGTGDWRSQARNLVRTFRAIAKEYPRCLALVLENGITITFGAQAIESALALCAEAGLDGATSVHVTRSIMAYALGSQLREAAVDRMVHHRRGLEDPVADRFPRLRSMGGEPTAEDNDADFEFGLDLFLAAIEARGGAG